MKLRNLTVIKGMIQEVIYRNDDNNYTVVLVDVNDELITATGKFPIINEGEWVELNGKFVLNQKYGEQFAVDSVKLSPPNTTEGLVRYLSSGLIPGVGPVTALNIVNKFGAFGKHNKSEGWVNRSILDVVNTIANEIGAEVINELGL